MLLHVQWRIDPSRGNDAQRRFNETGGPPPDGLSMIGRWHGIGGEKGFVVAESDDAVAVAKWLQEWSDLLAFEVTLVDEEASPR